MYRSQTHDMHMSQNHCYTMYMYSKQGRVHSNSKLHGNLPVRLVADQLKVLVAEAVNVRPLRVYAERLRARRLSAALLAPGQPQGPADKPVTQQALGHGRGASARGLPGTQPSSPSGHTRRRGRRCRRRWTPHGPHVPSRRPSGCCRKKWRRGGRAGKGRGSLRSCSCSGATWLQYTCASPMQMISSPARRPHTCPRRRARSAARAPLPGLQAGRPGRYPLRVRPPGALAATVGQRKPCSVARSVWAGAQADAISPARAP